MNGLAERIIWNESDIVRLHSQKKGGEGSGFFGHAGRPGLVGGSSSAHVASKQSELKELLRQAGAEKGYVSLEGIDPELADEVVNKVRSFISEHPNAAKKLSSVVTMDLPTGTFASTSSYAKNATLKLNVNWWYNKEPLESALRQAEKERHVAVGTVDGLLDHELGHVIHTPLDGSIYDIDEQTGQVSTYAKRNAAEGFAETFSLYKAKGLAGLPEGELKRSFSQSLNSQMFKDNEPIETCEDMALPYIDLLEKKGGEGSGFHGHAGRPGEVGGSAPSGIEFGDSKAGSTESGTEGADKFFNNVIGEYPSSVTEKIRAKFGNMVGMGGRLYELAKTDEQLKAQLATIGASQTMRYFVDNHHDRVGISPYVPRDDIEYGAQAFSASIQSHWASSSTDKNPTSIALQLAVAQKFGLNSETPLALASIALDTQGAAQRLGVAVGAEGGKEFDGAQIIKNISNSPAMRAYVDEVYKETQRQLQEAKINYMTLHRGMVWANEYSIPKELQPTGSRSVSLNPLSSFSSARGIARDFAINSSGGSGERILTTTIPRTRIFSMPRSGPGALNEYELVVIGGPMNVLNNKP